MPSPVTAAAITDLISKGPHRYELGRKQLTLALGGLYIASTSISARPLLVWEEEKGYARYYVPRESLHEDVKRRLNDSDSRRDDEDTVRKNPEVSGIDIAKIDSVTAEDKKSQAVIERLTVGSKSTSWVRFVEGPFKDFIRFERSEIDDWFENGALFVAIKNPYKRIDTATVSRHIIVKINGEQVAETNVAVLLNETGQKETYYIPATSIGNWGAVEKSDLRTACPYKGEAWYLSLTLKGQKYENLIWYYQYPTHESAALEGLISFYNKDGVDIIVDNVKI